MPVSLETPSITPPSSESGESIVKFGTMRELVDALVPWAYRVAAFFTLTILDDPAVLAMAFC